MSGAVFPDQQQNDGAPGEAQGESGGATDSEIQRFAEWYRQDKEARTKFWNEADECFAFDAGHQWSEEDLELLREQSRPSITFNRTQAYIESVSGLEVNNRQEVRYIPRKVGVQGADELATAAGKWVRDGCDAEDEESDAFRDALVCGEGWTQTTMCYDDDPDGLVVIAKRDPRQIVPDRNSRKANYADARRIFYYEDMPRADAEAMFPDIDPDDLDARWAHDTEDSGTDPVNRREASFYRDGQNGQAVPKDDVRIVECEWWEYETIHRVIDPTTRRFLHLLPKQFRELSDQAEAAGLGKLKSVKDKRKRYYRAILGNVVLNEGDGPERGGFTLKAITGKRDQKKHLWYGLVRVMRDPQMWSNKFLSQYLHMINSNAKGGLLAEEDAFANKNEAEDTWADPAAITFVTPGALSQGKIQPKVPPVLPQGVQFLLQYAISSISDVAGSNPEMMGQADRDQPGVVEEHRKQSAMVIYARLFASLRRYRKEQGRLLLWLIQRFIADGRLIRIGGQDEAQFVPLLRDPLAGEYDIVVDDTPTSPNMKERVWGAIVSLFPIMQKMNVPPQIMLAMLEYSPLPSTLVSKISGMAQQAGQQPHQDPATLAKAQLDQAGAALKQAQAAHVQVQAAKLKLDARGSGAQQAQDAAESQARVELMRAQAINALQDAGIQGDTAQFQQAKDAIDALVGLAQTHIDAQAQGHAQQMAQQAADQAAQQAAQPQQRATQ